MTDGVGSGFRADGMGRLKLDNNVLEPSATTAIVRLHTGDGVGHEAE